MHLVDALLEHRISHPVEQPLRAQYAGQESTRLLTLVFGKLESVAKATQNHQQFIEYAEVLCTVKVGVHLRMGALTD